MIKAFQTWPSHLISIVTVLRPYLTMYPSFSKVSSAKLSQSEQTYDQKHSGYDLSPPFSKSIVYLKLGYYFENGSVKFYCRNFLVCCFIMIRYFVTLRLSLIGLQPGFNSLRKLIPFWHLRTWCGRSWFGRIVKTLDKMPGGVYLISGFKFWLGRHIDFHPFGISWNKEQIRD